MSRKDFSREEQEQLAELALLPDAAIDTDDIPEAPAENWIDPRRGGLYRPIKQPVTLRLDADVVAWFKEHAPGGGYQSAINRVLRRHVADAEKRSR
jgi:uncharacterized protein (DUF4415 family)